MVVKLHDHQQLAVDKLDYGKILYGDVGGGKTITSLAFFYTKVCGGVLNDPASIRRPKKVYVITTAKVRDSLAWEKTAAAFGITSEDGASLPGITITVDSWNNIGKYTEVEDAFFIFDEQRLVGSGAWVKSFLKIAKSNGWILLSATPGDTWFDYLPVFIANGFFKNKTEFSREHVVWQPYTKFPKVLRYTGVNKLVRLKNQILVEMPFERHTTREIQDVAVDYDVALFNKVVKERWHPFEERPIRDVAELFLVMRKVVNSDASRAETVRKLWRKHRKLIVFYNFDYELEELRKLAENPPTHLQSVSGSISSSPTGKRSGSTTSSVEGPLPQFKLAAVPSTSAAVPSRSSESTSTTSNSESSQSSPTTIKSDASESSTQSSALDSGTSWEGSEWDTKSKPLSTTSTADGSRKSSSKSPMTSTRSSQTESGQATASETTGPASEQKMLPSVRSVAVAEWNGHKHEPIPKTDSWLYLVQYQSGAEGWNCVEANAMVFYSLTYSYKNFYQAQGRIDRLNTPFKTLKYYVLMSSSVIDRAVRRSLNEKKDFNERKFYERKAA